MSGDKEGLGAKAPSPLIHKCRNLFSKTKTLSVSSNSKWKRLLTKQTICTCLRPHGMGRFLAYLFRCFLPHNLTGTGKSSRGRGGGSGKKRLIKGPSGCYRRRIFSGKKLSSMRRAGGIICGTGPGRRRLQAARKTVCADRIRLPAQGKIWKKINLKIMVETGPDLGYDITC